MLARQIIATNLRASTCGVLRSASFSGTSAVSAIYEDEKPQRAVRKLKEWRKPPKSEATFLQSLNPPEPKGKQLKLLRRPLRLAPVEIKQWWNAQETNYEKYSQEFLQERHETLGCDLAAAHFLVHRNGKVKFVGQDQWIQKKDDGTYDLPSKYDPYWQLSHVDASGIKLYYQGLMNFINLGQVQWASFKGNPIFDDWCLDKIIAQMPKLQHLDISECKMLPERAVGALYKLYNLKTAVVTDWEKVPSFELICMMLEDLNPELKITIKEPENSAKKLGKQ